MLQISGLSKSYGKQSLFSDATFSINPGERIGLVGRNGHGKSTLFRILAGAEEPDSGVIHYSSDYRIGYLTQHLSFKEKTVLAEAASLLPIYDNSWREEHLAEEILFGLGFSQEQISQSPMQLSGGLQVRLHLAKLLASEPHLLLLDEPTNYLDIISLRWLLTFLTKWKHELLLITHDHAFMNQICTHTVGIHRSKLRKIQGRTDQLFEQIALEEEVHEQSRLNQEKKIKQTEVFIDTFRAKASKAKAVQSRVKSLEKMQTVEKLDTIENLRFSFNTAACPSKIILKTRDLSFGYQADSPLFSDLTMSIGRNDRIAVIGKNGKGKTTLLRLLAQELKPNTGTLDASPHLQLGYFGQTNIERLDPGLSVEQELIAVAENGNRTLARTIAGVMMFDGDNALKKISVLSGGEKSRVMLGKIILSETNLLLLDEPTNHLDMYSTDALIDALEEFPGALIFVSHSEHLVRKLATRLVVFDEGKASVVEGDYDQFLAKIGWSDEGGVQKTVSESPVLSKKERRKLRGEIINQRSKELKPLQNRIAELEERIISLESDIEKQTAELIEVTKDGFGDDGAKLSRVLHQNREEVESSYEELSNVSKEFDEANKEFEQRLAALDD